MTDPTAPEVPDAPDGLGVFDAPPPPPGAGAEQLAYAETASHEPRIAHPALRAFAFFLDGFATFLLVVAIVMAGISVDDAAFWAIPLVPLAAAALDTVLTAVRGVTPAKAVLGLRVVHAVTGAPIGFGRAILRSFVIVAPIALSYLLGLASSALPYEVRDAVFDGVGIAFLGPIAGWIALLVVLAVRPQHRGLQDLAGNSVVVRR